MAAWLEEQHAARPVEAVVVAWCAQHAHAQLVQLAAEPLAVVEVLEVRKLLPAGRAALAQQLAWAPPALAALAQQLPSDRAPLALEGLVDLAALAAHEVVEELARGLAALEAVEELVQRRRRRRLDGAS